MDDAGVYHRLLDTTYDDLSEIEDIIYSDESNKEYDIDMGDTFE